MADVAIRRASRIWGAKDRFWLSFQVPWRERLTESPGDAETPTQALASLRSDHAALARPDFERIHPSWLTRALEGESESVRAVVQARLPAQVSEAASEAPPPLPPSLASPSLPAHPDVVRSVLSIWAERLVGGIPADPGESLVTDILTGPERRDLVRLAVLAGLAKRACDPDTGPPRSLRSRERMAAFRASWGEVDPRLVQVARLDMAAHPGDLDRGLPRLGLVTFARLLDSLEPHRVRWALQHLPYGLAPYLRLTGAESAILPMPLILAWERRVLELARQRLEDERGVGDEP